MAKLIHNIDWLNANGSRNYPLEDRATKRDDAGRELPDGLLADLHVWFPQETALAAFVSSVTVTDQLVTVTINGHDRRPLQGTPAAAAFVPLAAVTILLADHQPGANYALVPFVDGVGGYVSFGLGLLDVTPGSWRFSDPAATPLLPRVARPYELTDYVTSFGRGTGTSGRLTGVIDLVAADPDVLTIKKEKVLLDGVSQDAVVFQLNEEAQGPTIQGKFLQPCGGTPESDKCRGGQITNLGGAVPDCDGVVTIYVSEVWPSGGQADLVASYANTKNDGTEPAGTDSGHTLNLDYNRGLSSVCPPKTDKIPGVDKLDNCDLCGDKEFQQTVEVTNTCFAYATGWRREPGYGDGNSFITISETFSIDLTGLSGVTFKGEADDCFMIVPATANVTQQPPIETYTPGSSVVFNVPASAVMFQDTYGWFMNKAGSTRQYGKPASAAKTFTDGVHLYTFPAGNSTNDGTGHMTSMATAGFRVISFGTTYTVAQLTSLGYTQTVNGKLVFMAKCVHVCSGAGFGKLEIVCNKA